MYLLGPGHVVSALDKATGALRWRVTVPVTRPTQQGYGLRLAGGRVIVGDFDVFGLDPSSGALVWQYHAPVGRQAGAFRLAAAGGAVYTASAGGYVYALDGASGAQRWATAVVDDTLASVFDPFVRNGVVYASVTQFLPRGPLTSGMVAAVDAATGRVLWRTSLPSRDPNATTGLGTGTIGAVAIADVVVTASAEGIIYGLDRVTGMVRWTAPVATDPNGQPRSSDYRQVVTSGDMVLVGSDAGTITALAADGHQLWMTNPGRGSIAEIDADVQFAYATFGGGQLAVMDAPTGRVLWIIDRRLMAREEGFLATPVREGSRLYVGGATFGSYALDLK